MINTAGLLNQECRTCFNPDKGWNSLTTKTKYCKKQIISYGELLQAVTKINTNLATHQDLPQFICGNCSRRLKLAHSFIQQAVEVNDNHYARLKERLKGLEIAKIKVEQNRENSEESVEYMQEIIIDIERCPELTLEDNGEESKFLEETEIDLESGVEITDKNQEDVTYLLNKSYANNTALDRNYDVESPALRERKQTQLNLEEYDSESCQTRGYDWEGSSNMNVTMENEENFDIAQPCSECNKIFINSKALAEHLKISHVPEEKKITCPLCANKYSSHSNMYIHMRAVHGPESVPVAMKRTIPESEYIYKCDKCPKKYCRKLNLIHHKKLKHTADSAMEINEGKRKTMDKGSLCPICGKYLAIRKGLVAHLRYHSGEKPYKCDWCDRRFLLSTQLNRHRRQHTGDKPHKCQLCGKCFAAPKDLRQHMASHSDERPFKCSLCERRYKSTSDLKVHFRTHSSERPYVCAVCGDSFQRPSSLRAHRIRHEKKNEIK